MMSCPIHLRYLLHSIKALEVTGKTLLSFFSPINNHCGAVYHKNYRLGANVIEEKIQIWCLNISCVFL